MEPWMCRFKAEGTVDYSQLTFDPGQNELIVGARNHLFRLNLEDLSLIQEAEWHCDEFTKGACFSRGKSEVVRNHNGHAGAGQPQKAAVNYRPKLRQSWRVAACPKSDPGEGEEGEEVSPRAPQEECQNYIRVLLVNGNRLFTCGTNAFTPICTNRTLTNLTEIHDQISGMARCPYNPLHNSTALITSSGELYAATAMDFSGRDPAIYRSLGGLPPLRTAQYNSKWLNEPNFVSSYDIGNFTYFFFRENAVEHDCGRTVFSRAGRVCKNDIGGRFLLEDTWTTFMKARLNCSRPGEIPFNYNELQGTFYLPELELLYGIFTTNVNSIAASAVCAFNLSAISQVFNGPFKYQENSRSAWLPYPNPNPDFQGFNFPSPDVARALIRCPSQKSTMILFSQPRERRGIDLFKVSVSSAASQQELICNQGPVSA
ncbi:Semaphorin-5A [Dissostichus eleginoides]|uniref:Semaphorin-5A n=1 Tax=Dissostichus eleginoides TaxID=100907 RepID=A0AAD9F216_DISEL|nr:Semaphorin-5A [Dissostichus eleginoides]